MPERENPLKISPKVLWLAVLGSVLFLGCPQVTYTEADDRRAPITTQTQAVIQNQNGSVQIQTTNDSAVVLHMTKRVTGPSEAGCQSRISDIQIAITDTGNKITVAVTEPATHGSYDYGVDIDARLPAFMATDIMTTNGDIAGTGFARPLKLTATNGNILMTNINAGVTAQTTRGTINLQDIQGLGHRAGHERRDRRRGGPAGIGLLPAVRLQW